MLVLGEFDPALTESRLLVVDATGDPLLPPLVKQAARKTGSLVNTADIAEECDFFMAGRVSRGPLQIAVSTAGGSPALARRIRLLLERRFPDTWSAYCEALQDIRSEIRWKHPDSPEQRMELAELLVDSTIELLDDPNSSGVDRGGWLAIFHRLLKDE